MNKKNCTIVVSKKLLLKRDFWHRMITAFVGNFEQEKINLEYEVFDDKKIDQKFLKKLVNLKTDAYILIHDNLEAITSVLATLEKPIIVIDPKYKERHEILVFQLANRDAGHEAIRYLNNLGHKSICFYGTKNYTLSHDERFAGAILEAKERKIKFHPLLFENQNNEYSDDELLRKYLQDRSRKITALICANDNIALKAYKTIFSLGLKIPEDISVIGFDDLVRGQFVEPPLTTFSISYEEIGVGIGRFLLDYFKTKDIFFHKVYTRFRFVQRNSVSRSR